MYEAASLSLGGFSRQPEPTGFQPVVVQFSEEGCFLKFCDEVRTLTKLPLCGVGNLISPDFVEEQLARGRIDCAAMSRQLIADPAWVNKVITGKTNEIHHCVHCNQKCLDGMQQHQGVHCIYEKECSK